MQAVSKNPQPMKVVEGDRRITVAVTFRVSEDSNQRTALLNAAQALKFYADNAEWPIWADKIVIE